MLELNERFLPFLQKKARYKIAYGGRAGSKSQNFGTMLLIQGAEKPHLIACLREYQKNLEDSVYRLLCNKIRQDNFFTKFYRIYSDTIVGKNGTEFKFSGIKNARNFKSFEGATRVWVEEAQTISTDSMTITIPTIRAPGSELWFSYNPDSEEDPIHQRMLNPFIMTPEQLKLGGYDIGQINIMLNYIQNPHCPEIMKIEAEHMKKYDYESYKHVWLGECRHLSDAIIFKNRFEVFDFEVENYFGIPRMNGEMLTMYYGLDFGWVHPTAFIETFIQDGYVYISAEIVGKEMDFDDMTNRYYNEFLFNKGKIIYADSAEPRSIEILSNSRVDKHGNFLQGMMIEPATKGQGSVEASITWLKSFKSIRIHPSCINTIDNFKKFSYKKDKNDVILPEIIKLDDDCIAALRYAYSPLIKSQYEPDWSDPGFINPPH